MSWNIIALRQDGVVDLELLLRVHANRPLYPIGYQGDWWYADSKRYFYPDTSNKGGKGGKNDFVWQYIGGVVEIGQWGNTAQGHLIQHLLRLWPAKRAGSGELSVDSDTDAGNAWFYPGIGPWMSGLDMKKPVTWKAVQFGSTQINFGSRP